MTVLHAGALAFNVYCLFKSKRSGCISSAESALMTPQSHTEVLTALAADAVLPDASARRVPMLSIAPQSLALLAAALNSGGQQRRGSPALCAASRGGLAHVFDTMFAPELALREHFAECDERRAAAKEPGAEGTLPILASACRGFMQKRHMRRYSL